MTIYFTRAYWRKVFAAWRARALEPPPLPPRTVYRLRWLANSSTGDELGVTCLDEGEAKYQLAVAAIRDPGVHWYIKEMDVYPSDGRLPR